MLNATFKRVRNSVQYIGTQSGSQDFADFTIIRCKDICQIDKISFDDNGIHENCIDISFAVHTQKHTHYAAYEGITLELAEQAKQELESDRFRLIHLAKEATFVGVGLGILEANHE